MDRSGGGGGTPSGKKEGKGSVEEGHATASVGGEGMAGVARGGLFSRETSAPAVGAMATTIEGVGEAVEEEPLGIACVPEEAATVDVPPKEVEGGGGGGGGAGGEGEVVYEKEDPCRAMPYRFLSEGNGVSTRITPTPGVTEEEKAVVGT